jgi:hypothetical protein
MTHFMQQIDTDTTWFIFAVLVVLMLSAAAGWVGAKMELADHRRKRIEQQEAQYARWQREWDAATDVPTFMRESAHPFDAIPNELRTVIHPEPVEDNNHERWN